MTPGALQPAILVLVLLALAAPDACAQDVEGPDRTRVLAFARRHADIRLLFDIQRRLGNGWRGGEEGVRDYMRRVSLESEFFGWLGRHRDVYESVRSSPEGVIEVVMKVPSGKTGLFLSDAARKLDPQAEGWKTQAFEVLGRGSDRFLDAVGVGLPEAVSWSLRGEPVPAAWKRLNSRARTDAVDAAWLDAKENLWKSIESLPAGKGLFVRTFLEKDADLRRGLKAYLSSKLDVGLSKPRYLSKGRCEVDVYLDLADLDRAIEMLARSRLSPDSPWRNVDREHFIAENDGMRMLWATGVSFSPGFSSFAESEAPDWRQHKLEAEGEAELPVSAPSQRAAVGMAAQAAQEAAREALYEKVLSLRHPCGKTLAALARRPGRRNGLRALVWRVVAGKGSMVGRRLYKRPIEIPLEKVWNMVKDWE